MNKSATQKGWFLKFKVRDTLAAVQLRHSHLLTVFITRQAKDAKDVSKLLSEEQYKAHVAAQKKQ